MDKNLKTPTWLDWYKRPLHDELATTSPWNALKCGQAELAVFLAIYCAFKNCQSPVFSSYDDGED